MSESETKSSYKLWIAVIGLFAIIIFQTVQTCEKQDHVSSDTIIYLQKEPVINNYVVNNPTKVKETTIVYDSTKATLTRQDSDLIVIDYLKRREYSDTIKNDTTKFFYTAIVEKNALKKIDVTNMYRPKVLQITKTIEKFNDGLYLGLAPAMIGNNSLSIGANVNYSFKKYQIGTILDPIKKNYYFYASKRIGFK